MSKHWLQWPRHPHFVYTQTDCGGAVVIDTQILQRLHNIEVGFAAGDNAQTRLGTINNNAVDMVCQGKGAGRINFVFIQPAFLIQGSVGPTQVDTISGQNKVLGQHDIDAMGIYLG